jgi:transcription termination factor Rho
MEKEDTNQETTPEFAEKIEDQQKPHTRSPDAGPPTITKIAEIQRMNIDQLNLFGKKFGL